MGSSRARYPQPRPDGHTRHRRRLRHPSPTQGPRTHGHHRLHLEGRHFRREWHPAESVGHRTLARGLSDLAAMGARPLAAFLSLALPAEMLAARSGRVWVERFFTGMRDLADWARRAAGRWRHLPVALRPGAGRHCAPRFGACRTRVALVAEDAPEMRSMSPANLGGAAAELAAMQTACGERNIPLITVRLR